LGSGDSPTLAEKDDRTKGKANNTRGYMDSEKDRTHVQATITGADADLPTETAPS
jgi:hypothetical protein